MPFPDLPFLVAVVFALAVVVVVALLHLAVVVVLLVVLLVVVLPLLSFTFVVVPRRAAVVVVVALIVLVVVGLSFALAFLLSISRLTLCLLVMSSSRCPVTVVMSALIAAAARRAGCPSGTGCSR